MGSDAHRSGTQPDRWSRLQSAIGTVARVATRGRRQARQSGGRGISAICPREKGTSQSHSFRYPSEILAIRAAIDARCPTSPPCYERFGDRRLACNSPLVPASRERGSIRVGILAIEDQEIAGTKMQLFVINFIKDKMTLRVPTAKVANVGMRKLSEPALVKRALETLKGRARIKRTMWSRRAQEYEAKINSGDIVAIAEVVRDLYRSESQPEQSYSERQLYEAALDRLSREIAVVQHVTETEAVKEIESQLVKSPRRGAKVETEAGAEGEADADADLDDADGDAVADEAA